MTQIERKVTLLAHTQLAKKFYDSHYKVVDEPGFYAAGNELRDISDGQAVALSAIRTCYSANKPSEILAKEGKRYFGTKATDGGVGTEADRLIRTIQSSKHTSTLEHISFTFAIEGVSRALLAQLTRHRVGFSFSVQSQRYVRLGSNDKSGGFDYILPETIEAKDSEDIVIYEIDRIEEDADGNVINVIYSDEVEYMGTLAGYFDYKMKQAQQFYDSLRAAGIPAEDARACLPNATATHLVMTANLTALLGLYSKRRKGNGAQAEVAGLVEDIRKAVVEVEPWCAQLFEATD